MFLDLIDLLPSINKSALLDPSILQLFWLAFLRHLFIVILPSDLQSYSTLFSTTLSSLLDKHAPLKTISCNSRPNKPFITPEILREKTKRSKLETIYRRCKTEQNKVNFKN